MDTYKDKERLEVLNNSSAPWKVWSPSAQTVSNGDKAVPVKK
jgi:hypothetical protein